MTATRAWDFSGELHDLEIMSRGRVPLRSTLQANTGSYSWRTEVLTTETVMGVPMGSDYLRAAVFLYVEPGGTEGIRGDLNLFGFHHQLNTGLGVNVVWMEGEERLDLVIDGSIEDTILLSAMDDFTTSSWFHMGLVASVANSFASFYINGTQVMSYSGAIANQPWDAVYLTSKVSTFSFWTAGYTDDGYVDVMSDDEADAAPPMYRFLPCYVLAVGDDADFTPLSGSNYQMVDDGAVPDDDTTYNKATTSAGSPKDTFSCDDVAIPEGYEIVAAHPFSIVRKLDAAEDAQIKNTAWDGLTLAEGSAQSVPISYGIKKARMTTQPDGEDWNEADFNAMEYGYVSGGSF